MSNEAPIHYNPHDHYKVRKKKTEEVLVEREFETLPEPPRIKPDPGFEIVYKKGEFRPTKSNENIDCCAGCGKTGKTHKDCAKNLYEDYLAKKILSQIDNVEYKEVLPRFKNSHGGLIFETNKLRRKIKQKGIWIEKEEIH